MAIATALGFCNQFVFNQFLLGFGRFYLFMFTEIV